MWLIKEGRLHPSVRESGGKLLETKFVFPPDIIEAIKKNGKASRNYQNFSLAYQRIQSLISTALVTGQLEFEKRLNNFISKTEQNKLIGFGGIEKYY